MSIITIIMARMRNMNIITIMTARNAAAATITMTMTAIITIITRMRSLPAGEQRHRKNTRKKKYAASWSSSVMKKSMAWSCEQRAC